MAHKDYDPDLNNLGRQLRGLTPRPCPINRDAVMFRAGQASMPRNWLWPVATALSTCLAITFGAALLVQPAFEHRVEVAPPWKPDLPNYRATVPGAIPSDGPGEAPGEGPAATEDDVWPAPQTGYFHAENKVLRWGLDGIASPPALPPSRPAEKPEMLLRSF
jgi:hypothetical protein